MNLHSLFVSLVYYAESTVRWFVVREKHCWMAADSADKSKRTGLLIGTRNNNILIQIDRSRVAGCCLGLLGQHINGCMDRVTAGCTNGLMICIYVWR
jgi:hypothetical protein